MVSISIGLLLSITWFFISFLLQQPKKLNWVPTFFGGGCDARFTGTALKLPPAPPIEVIVIINYDKSNSFFHLPPNDVDITDFLDLTSNEGRLLLLLELILLTRTGGAGISGGGGTTSAFLV